MKIGGKEFTISGLEIRMGRMASYGGGEIVLLVLPKASFQIRAPQIQIKDEPNQR
jgi:hypothetical protein